MHTIIVIWFLCALLPQIPAKVEVIEDSFYPYTVCRNVTILRASGARLDEEIKALERCQVIEGHLEIRDVTLKESTSFPNLLQVTDYVVLYFVEGVESLATLFPRLSVVRGRSLFYHYSFVLIDNHDLREIGPWSLQAILKGAVRLEDNVLLCIESKSKLTAMTNQKYHNHHYFKNNFDICPMAFCEEQGWCMRNEEKSCAQNALGCFADINCHPECLGGCTSGRNASACAACKNFFLGGECVPKCPENYLQYLDYRCISRQQCLAYGWVMFNETLSPIRGISKCVEKCPEGYVLRNDSMICGPRQASDPCDSATITGSDLGGGLKDCTIINGNLVIMVTGGRNVSHQLERNLGNLRIITGYLKVIGANALLSLSFLSNLRLIKGEQTAYDGCTLCVLENSNLEELWNWERKKHNLTIAGLLFVAFNDRLCPQEVEALAMHTHGNKDRLTFESNGKNAQCRIFRSPLTAVPGYKPGSVSLSWYHNYCGVDARNIIGYYIYYRETRENITIFDERDFCNDKTLWSRYVLKFENPPHTGECITNFELEDLKPNTRYAIYATTFGTDNRLLQTDLVYVTTYDVNPAEPQDGEVTFEGNDVILSWKGFHTSSSGFFELQILLEPEKRIPDYSYHQHCHLFDKEIAKALLLGTEAHDDSQRGKKPATFLTHPKGRADPSCSCDLISDPKTEAYLQRERIAIENEISRLRHITSEKMNKMNVESNHTASPVQEISPLDLSLSESTCKVGSAPPGLCSKAQLNWKNSPLKFYKMSNTFIVPKKAIRLPYGVGSRFRTHQNSFNATLPEDLYLPFRISIKIRACVGEMKPCRPLNSSSSSCALCSDFYSFVAHKSHEGLSFDVRVDAVWPHSSKNESSKVTPGNVPRYEYSECKRNLFLPQSDSLPSVTSHLSSSSPGDKTQEGFASSSGEKRELKITWHLRNYEKAPSILGYKLQIVELDASERRHSPLCLSRLSADRMENELLVAVSPSQSYYVALQVRTASGYSSMHEKCIKMKDSNLDLWLLGGIATFLITFIVLVSIIYVYFFRKKPVLEHGHTSNDNYAGPLRNINPELRKHPDMLRISDEELGKGNFGLVLKGELVKDDTRVTVALKTIIQRAGHDESRSREERITDLLNEAEKVQYFQSSFIVKLLAVYFDERGPDLYLAFEYMNQKNLKDFLQNSCSNPISEQTMVEMAVQIADGMAYLSNQNYIHGDLAARNCLLESLADSTLRVKISDFGLSRYLDSDYYTPKGTNKLVPVRWMPPEYLAPPEYLSLRSDVWSYGVLLWEILNNARKPYEDQFRELSYFDTAAACDSESTKGFDEGCFVGNSLNVSQEEEEPMVRSSSTFIQPYDLSSSSSLTRESDALYRSSCFSLAACGVGGALNCTKGGRRRSVSEEVLCPKRGKKL